MWEYNHELYHHGIKGQKWGVRRFQNPDGSLTPEGRERYGVAVEKVFKTGHISVPDKYAPSKKQIAEVRKAVDKEFTHVDDEVVKNQYAMAIASEMIMPREFGYAIEAIHEDIVAPLLLDEYVLKDKTFVKKGILTDELLEYTTMAGEVYSWGIFCNVYSEMTEED